MRRALIILLFGVVARLADASELTALVYHDIVENRGSDEYALTIDEFEEHLAYLKKQGYRPISLADLSAARQGKVVLPDRAVLITFDDGLRSYRRHALPLLKRYGYPSVVSVVSRWVDGGDMPAAYRNKVMDWDELRSLQTEPLVEIASHTHDLHHELPANAHGDKWAAGTVRRYDTAQRGHENETQFQRRIKSDLLTAVARFRQELKQAPRALAWPYGEYDGTSLGIASSLGFEFQFTLDDRPNGIASLPRVHRVMLRRAHGVAALDEALRGPRWAKRPIRFVHVPLADIGPADRHSAVRGLAPVLRQLELLRVNAVVIALTGADMRGTAASTTKVGGTTEILSHVLYALRRAEIREIYLDVSKVRETPNGNRLAELLFLNRAQGIILSDAIVEQELAVLRRAHPQLRIGSYGDSQPAWADFRFVTNDAGRATTLPEGIGRTLAGGERRTVLHLNGQSAQDVRTLAGTLRAIRTSGLADFGLSYSLLPPAGTASIALALELAGHSPGRP
jgi:peptidoglycan/xylan/chitin deacetylase (PgdA/CDA1 family)